MQYKLCTIYLNFNKTFIETPLAVCYFQSNQTTEHRKVRVIESLRPKPRFGIKSRVMLSYEYSIVRNKRRPYAYLFWTFFQALQPYQRLHKGHLGVYSLHRTCVFNALRLFFLPNFPGPTFIPCPTSIPDSRVYHFSYYTYWLKNFPPLTNIRTG